MELRVLRYFLMVAREENITRAAEHLHITQPTLSRQLQQLEEELGCKLFDRSSHNIMLTEDGMRFHDEIQKSRDHMEEKLVSGLTKEQRQELFSMLSQVKEQL